MFKKLFGKKTEAAASANPLVAAWLAEPFAIADECRDTHFEAQDPQIQTFLGVLHRIMRDVLLVSKVLRSGAALPKLEGAAGTVPIYWQNIEALFVRTNAQGEKTYSTFNYTSDLRSFDPNAQVHLSQFFGRIFALNGMLTSDNPAVRGPDGKAIHALLDRTLLDTIFFGWFLKTHNLAMKILTRKIPEADAGIQFQALVSGLRMDLQSARSGLFDAETALKTLPNNGLALAVDYGKPYEEGQININGVYFDKAMGAKLMESAVQNQARAFAGRAA